MERLDKILVSQGIGSRSEVQKLIKKKNVAVDGEIVTKPDYKVEPENAEIKVAGQALSFKKHLYIMMNKPAGVVSATKDSRDKTVLDILPDKLRRKNLAPVGRLDKDTEGLMIISDDGDFAHRVLSPKKHIYKKYYAELNGKLTEKMIESFKNGITLKDGTRFLPAELTILSENSAYVEIREGKFHQVKKMFSSQGLSVTYLKRVKIGGLSLDSNLHIGECRELTDYEKQTIFIGI
ncbi:MAG: rRNA pseudouridine synthase [Ruminococcus sp.]|nr:rRNA pseudouridine synthase [Ruminococcus sp.]